MFDEFIEKLSLGGKLAVKYGFGIFTIFYLILIVVPFFTPLLYFSIVIIFVLDVFTIPFIIMNIAFVGVLYYFGNNIEKEINAGKKNILSLSANFSFGVNIVLWIVTFIALCVFGNDAPSLSGNSINVEEDFFREHYIIGMFFTMFAIVVFGSMTTFSIGLFIVNKIKTELRKTA
ncbi:hypothetical protein [Aquimarina sp. 2304DJ70-9]|uniref:hypothetical protein n=1 Tax=Aquimarina penaris TaxID=3231044 RepID=UPI00346319B0